MTHSDSTGTESEDITSLVGAFVELPQEEKVNNGTDSEMEQN